MSSENLKFAYVILHFNTVEDTYACVASIRKNYKSNIVIVCNHSSNGSDKTIMEHYNGAENIYVIENKENLGFAKGNNVGIEFARNNKLGDIITCINSDIIVHDDFEEEIGHSYIKNKWAVCGPDVLNPSGVHCNPRYEDYPTVDSVSDALKMITKQIKRCERFGGIGEIFFCINRRLFSKQQPATNYDKNIMTLHGCCIVFSPKYFECFDGFYPKTYLYGEEIILAYTCDKEKLPVEYVQTAKVLHNESGSTKAALKNMVSRHLFYYKNYYDSTKVLLELVNEA